MTEIEKLILEVQSRGIAGVNRELGGLDNAAKRAGVSLGATHVGLLRFTAVAAVAAYGAKKLVGLLVDSTKAYQGFNAQLLTSLKSQEKVNQATEALVQFAATTPYSVGEATQAFIKLINLGLTPSEQALRSYGNTASSMGKGLNDMIEAVADAATGEFERLKEFGIKASQQGDKVTFTFKGVSTTVGKSAKEIEGFLIGLGEKDFAGAMARQMDTLNGNISNFGDAWDQLWITISKQGADSFFQNLFKKGGDALTEFNTMIASGELRKRAVAYGILWSNVTDDIADSFHALTEGVNEATKQWTTSASVSEKEFIDFFRYLPINAQAALTQVTNYFVNLFDNVGAHLTSWATDFDTRFEQIVGYAKAAGLLIEEFMFGPSDKTFDEAVADVNALAAKRLAEADAIKEARIKAADEEYEHIADLVVKDHDDRVAAYKDALRQAEEARTQWDLRMQTRNLENQDRLGQLAPQSATSMPKASKEFEARIAFLEAGLVGENRVLEASYDARKELVMASTETTEQSKADLILRLLKDSLMTETDSIREAYETRRGIVLSSTETTETVKTALMLRLTEEREAAIKKIEEANMAKRLDQASQFFGNIASIGSTFGKKGFEIAKGAAIAQATIDTYKAATGAYASLSAIPYVGPALGIAAAAAAVAAGAANIAKIKSQTYAGAYEHGGMIPGGSYGLVGEAGPEFVKGPAVVTSASTTAASRRNSSGVRTVTVHNNGEPVQASSRMNGDELIIMLEPLLRRNKAETKKELAGELRKGGGNFSRTLESQYGLNRSNGGLA